MHEVIIDRDDANSDSIIIRQWLVGNRTAVQAGDAICVIETSKADIEVEAPVPGYLNHIFPEGTTVDFGQCIARIAPALESLPPLEESPAEPRDAAASVASTRPTTHKASELARSHQIDLHGIPGDGVITEQQVHDWLAPPRPETMQAGQLPQTTEALERTPGGSQRLVVLGGGGFGKECLSALQATGAYELVGVVDGGIPIGTDVLGVPVIAGDSDDDLRRLLDDGVRNIVVGAAFLRDLQARDAVRQRLERLGFTFPNVIHANASVAPSSRLGDGVIVMANGACPVLSV